MRTFDEMVNGPKQETRTFSDMAKSTYQGKGKRVGTKGNYRYIYDDKKSKPSNKKEGMFSKLFGGMKKLFGKKPTPSSREKLEKLATDKGMLSSISKLTDLKALLGLRDMLLAHGAEEKKPRAAEPREPVESEDNFDTMPEADPEPKERKERKTNPLNKLLALVNKRIGQLEAEKPEKKDEPPKSEDNFDTMPESEKGDPFEHGVDFEVMYGPTIKLSTNERIALSLVLHRKSAYRRDEARKVGMDEELYDKTIEELKTKGVLGKNGGLRRIKGMTAQRAYEHVKNQGVTVEPWDMKKKGIRAYIEPKSEDNFDTMPESNAQGTQSTKDADAAHPEDRHEEVPDRKTRGLGEHNDKLSNIILDGKPLSDDTEFLDHLEVDDYPYGRQRTTAKFTIETDKQGRQRAVMQTVNPKTGRENKPKKATYAQRMKFFMHEGKTYVLEYDTYGALKINTVAGGFRSALIEEDGKKKTAYFSSNDGSYEHLGDEHPAGYMSLYEAATGEPAPKVQDFKDARKRMVDRAANKAAQARETAQAREESGTGASYGSLASYAQDHKRLIDEDIVRFGRNTKFVNGVAKGDFRLSHRDGTKPKGSGIVAGQYGLDAKGAIHHIPSGMRVGDFSSRSPAKRVAILLALDKNHKKFGSDLRGGGETFTDQQNAELSRISETIKATIHDAKTPDDAHREIRDLMPASLLSKEEKAAKAAANKDAATAKTQAKLDSLGHFKEDKKLSFFARPGAVLKAAVDLGSDGKKVMSSEAHKLAAEFASKDKFRPNIANVLHRNGEAIASDGHRMIIVPTDNRQEGSGFILPGKAKDREHKNDVKKNADRYGPSLVAEMNERHTRKEDAAGMANVDPVISSVRSGATNKAIASVPHLQAAADHALAAAKKDGLSPADAVIVLEMEGNHLLATSQAEGHGVMRIGKTDGAVGTQAEPKVRIGLSAKYIKDALRHSGKNADKKSVSISVEDKNSAMMIEHDNGVQHIIMPVRLEGASRVGRTSTAEEKLEAFNSYAEFSPDA